MLFVRVTDGSILGPLLFTLYANDMSNVSESLIQYHDISISLKGELLSCLHNNREIMIDSYFLERGNRF